MAREKENTNQEHNAPDYLAWHVTQKGATVSSAVFQARLRDVLEILGHHALPRRRDADRRRHLRRGP